MMKLQVIQNKALRFAFNERYPFTKNSKTLHEQANLKPINYNLFTRATIIFRKIEMIDNLQFNYILEDYEPEKNEYFKKTKL